nr:MAG TPA: hypothetical protein [Caudoviricetes sp.]
MISCNSYFWRWRVAMVYPIGLYSCSLMCINRGYKFYSIPKYNPSATLTPNTDVYSKEIHMYTSNVYTYVSNIRYHMYNVCYKRLHNKCIDIQIMHMSFIIVYFRLYERFVFLHMFIFELCYARFTA